MDLSNLLGSLLSDGQTIDEIAKKVGARPEEVQKAAKLSVPTLVEALNKNAKDEEKRASLNKALEDHSEDNVEDLQGFLGSMDLQDGQKMLGHILGGKKNQVESSISKSSGLSSSQVTGLLAMLAPVLIGMLGKKKKEEKLRSKTQRRPDDPQGDDQPADGQPSGDAAAPDQPTGAPGA